MNSQEGSRSENCGPCLFKKGDLVKGFWGEYFIISEDPQYSLGYWSIRYPNGPIMHENTVQAATLLDFLKAINDLRDQISYKQNSLRTMEDLFLKLRRQEPDQTLV